MFKQWHLFVSPPKNYRTLHWCSTYVYDIFHVGLNKLKLKPAFTFVMLLLPHSKTQEI